MRARHPFGRTANVVAAGAGLAAAAYLGHAGWTWLRFGAASEPPPEAADPLLNAFMPRYDVVERHHMAMDAPADVALAAAAEVDTMQSPIARSIFAARAIALGGSPDQKTYPKGLFDVMRSIGWEVLAQVPGREIVFGAVTTPWDAEPVFRAVGAPFFAGFDEPGYVKIVWTLRADPADRGCIFRTETRAVATDEVSRARFRWYWSFVSPGVRVIRRLMLAPVKEEAERRARATRAA